MEDLPYSHDLAPNDFWLFPKIKSALKGRRYQDTEDNHKKCDNGTENYWTPRLPKTFNNCGSIVGLSVLDAQVENFIPGTS